MTSRNQNILLVYPEFPPTYWGLQYGLHATGMKSVAPPLGLITIAALTPPGYAFRLVDMNCRPLTDEDLEWADLVCFSAMLYQAKSLFKESSRAKAAGKLVIFGGPFPTQSPEMCKPHCDVMILNEGELTWPMFLKDLEKGKWKDLYTTPNKPDLAESPLPRFDLLEISDYTVIAVQFCRGCPFNCEFCDVTSLFGRKIRPKRPYQVIAEIEAVYMAGHRGLLLFADDNFIGNKKKAKELLTALNDWNVSHQHPFFYMTQASVDLADDEELLNQMVKADFKGVFLGIETPSLDSLKETGKYQNLNSSLLDSVKTIQNAGLVIHGGFIVGFDNDGEDIFDRQIEFIRQSAISNAYLEFLFAYPGTLLWKRLKKEGRLADFDYMNFKDAVTNIKTVLPERTLLEGYRKVVKTIYNPQEYLERTLDQFSRLPRPTSFRAGFENLSRIGSQVITIFRSDQEKEKKTNHGLLKNLSALMVFIKDLPPEYRGESLRFLWNFLRTCPERLPGAVLFIFQGVHMYKYTYEYVIKDIEARLKEIP